MAVAYPMARGLLPRVGQVSVSAPSPVGQQKVGGGPGPPGGGGRRGGGGQQEVQRLRRNGGEGRVELDLYFILQMLRCCNVNVVVNVTNVMFFLPIIQYPCKSDSYFHFKIENLYTRKYNMSVSN